MAKASHTAVNELLDGSSTPANRLLRPPPLTVDFASARRGRSLSDDGSIGAADVCVPSRGSVGQVRDLAAEAVVVIGGTTNGVLKLADTLATDFPRSPDSSLTRRA